MINLLLAIHNHQPVGNFGHVFEKAFKTCYWPVLNTLAEFPKVRISLHHSGPLLDWAREHEKAYIPTLCSLIKKGQVEPLGGGYYEPILAVIPPRDAGGQLKMMQDFWEAEAGVRPSGIWTTERIWEPSLATTLAENGIKYTMLDDEHFRAAGVTDNPIRNYYITERHGHAVSIFPSDQTLRYHIPFKYPEDVIGYLTYLADTYPGSSVGYGDDGEKFGMWPGTYEWVIEKGWLKRFFQLLSDRTDKINTCTISEYLKGHKPTGRIYLPTCSYPELCEWTMPAKSIHRLEGVKQFLTESGKWEEAKTFVRGGFWDNFLTKYPESNYMHKKMLYVSDKIEKAKGKGETGKVAEATKHLYMAQCNCSYWHGLFGGLYLNYLRHAVFENLIKAENIIDKSLGTKHQALITAFDMDCDLSDEVVMANEHLIAVAKPSLGAGLLELSHRRSCLNLRNVLARREEAYHRKPKAVDQAEHSGDGIASIHNLNKDPTKAGPIVYDDCDRLAFCDHVWPANVSPIDCVKGAAAVAFSNLEFETVTMTDDHATFRNRSNGMTVEKTYTMKDRPELSVKYRLTFDAPVKDAVRFGTALNLSLLAGHDNGRYFLKDDGSRQLMDVTAGPEPMKRLRLVDEHFKLELDISCDREMDVWRYPVNTVSQSESGFDLMYQGSCIIWSLVIPAGSTGTAFDITLKFNN